MTHPAIPHSLALRRFSTHPQPFSGFFVLDGLERFQSCLSPTTGSASPTENLLHLDLILKRDLAGRALILGQFSIRVALTCQRCLNAFQYPVSGTIKWLLLEQNMETDVRDFDAIECKKGLLSFKTALEDELILALPTVALHADPADCIALNSALKELIV